MILVDDHSLCRNGLTDLLQHRGGMQVAAATGDPTRVVDLLREHRPDLVVLDLRMPTTDGLSLLRHIPRRGRGHAGRDPHHERFAGRLAAALRAGVKGYLLRTWSPRT